jgi:hypothetical protein
VQLCFVQAWQVILDALQQYLAASCKLWLTSWRLLLLLLLLSFLCLSLAAGVEGVGQSTWA